MNELKSFSQQAKASSVRNVSRTLKSDKSKFSKSKSGTRSKPETSNPEFGVSGLTTEFGVSEMEFGVSSSKPSCLRDDGKLVRGDLSVDGGNLYVHSEDSFFKRGSFDTVNGKGNILIENWKKIDFLIMAQCIKWMHSRKL